jgi:hypothetical protein
MLTSSAVDFVVQLNTFFKGLSPTNAGRVSFPVNQSGTMTLSENTFCYDIRFADLVLEGGGGGTYHFRLENDDAEGMYIVGDGDGAKNLSGAYCALFTSAGLFFLQSNAPANISGLFTTLPPTIDAGGIILIKSEILGDEPGGAGDPVIDLEWTPAAIAAVGQSNFNAKLVFAAFV